VSRTRHTDPDAGRAQLMTRSSEVPGDMHLLRTMSGGATAGNKGSKRSTWCGLEDVVVNMGRGKWKATYNLKIVTCGDCLVNYSDGDGDDGDD
jgi:hypothetical protein